eukprot:CAMPEP_0185772618 /NCGR_PEP_ID=MMETSP1174-20130828/69889_1 /TAXON_ID=35687 /ORGANISM="Dictyocha speculum, Strain CCMP1381" /LENGTH=32 /DNA_ID= /DNA_START= /DNA_END= /DNA_ORIENTATION=
MSGSKGRSLCFCCLLERGASGKGVEQEKVLRA